MTTLTQQFKDKVKTAIENDDPSIIDEYMNYFNCRDIKNIFNLNEIFKKEMLSIEYTKGKIMTELIKRQKQVYFLDLQITNHFKQGKTMNLELFYENAKCLINEYERQSSEKNINSRNVLLNAINTYLTDDMIRNNRDIVIKINNFLTCQPTLSDRLNLLN